MTKNEMDWEVRTMTQHGHWKSGIAFVLFASFMLVGSCSRWNAGESQTTLQFSTQASLGKVLIRPTHDETLETYKTPPEAWQELAEARGEVVVPAGMAVKLEIPYEEKVSLAPLRNFDPNAIHTLQLGGSRITDDELLDIRGLTGLSNLYLRAPAITDVGFTVVRKMTKLRSLELWWSGITDEGLENLRDLRELENLVLVGARISDDGVRNLSEMTNLKTLWLSETPVGDEALEHLKNVMSLEHLYIRNTRISDASVDAILAHKKLAILDISWTELTPAGVERIKTGLDHARVMYDPNPNPRSHLKELPNNPGSRPKRI